MFSLFPLSIRTQKRNDLLGRRHHLAQKQATHHSRLFQIACFVEAAYRRLYVIRDRMVVKAPFYPVCLHDEILSGRVAVECQADRTAGNDLPVTPEPNLADMIMRTHDKPLSHLWE